MHRARLIGETRVYAFLTSNSGRVVFVPCPQTRAASRETAFAYGGWTSGGCFDQETGLHYNYFRDYDPATGRYTTSDPIGLAGGVNTYSYVDGNPVSFADSFGLDRWGSGTGAAAPFDPAKSYCGAGNGIQEWVIPDWLFGIPINKPCYNHDVCYATCGKSKVQCDNEFQEDIEKQCGLANSKQIRDECYRMARQYRGSVGSFGQSAYDGAQKEAGCCEK